VGPHVIFHLLQDLFQVGLVPLNLLWRLLVVSAVLQTIACIFYSSFYRSAMVIVVVACIVVGAEPFAEVAAASLCQTICIVGLRGARYARGCSDVGMA
jgi:hypothetical protein